jgi:hypothetical protein
VILLRPDPNARIYTTNGFLTEYAPQSSGSYSLPKPYLGSDSLKSMLSGATDKVKGMYSNVLTSMKDTYKSLKNESPKLGYDLSFSYR